jgi:hypothetical protein
MSLSPFVHITDRFQILKEINQRLEIAQDKVQATYMKTYTYIMVLIPVLLSAPRLFAQDTNGTPGNLTLAERGKWIKLFDGQSLQGWAPLEKTKYNMDSKAEVKDGAIQLAVGGPYSAVLWSGEFPLTDYEVKLRVKRTDGYDIFCGILFPVDKKFCSLVVGGWGNNVTGLSCVDEMFADENETAVYRSFENQVWFAVRLRVTDPKIEVWIDDKPVISLNRENHRISPYPGLDMFAPLGLFTYDTAAALTDIYFRRL